MSIWETTFNDTFFLTLAGLVFGFGGLMLRACLKSRCKEFHCLGVSCIGDVASNQISAFIITLANQISPFYLLRYRK